MARLLPLLDALLDRNAEELVLAHGRRPALRLGHELHPVAKQELTANQIQALLGELADSIGVSSRVTAPGRHDYELPDGRIFVCEIAAGTEEALTATVRPKREAGTSRAAPDPVSAGFRSAAGTSRPSAASALPEPRADAVHRIAGRSGGLDTLDALLRRMFELGASDLHFRSGEQPMVRIDGEMTRLPQAGPATGEAVSRMLLEVMPEKNRIEYERTRDTDFALDIPGLCRFRVNIFTDHKGRGHEPHGELQEGTARALREDPDIVLVGELRDLETIAIAIDTAETGHPVFGTLHTSSACGTVDRVIDQFPADRQAQIRTMLSESLKGVISQNLRPRSGGGRVAALEVRIVTSAISNLIREGKTFQIQSLMQTGKRHGMQLMNDSLLALRKQKLVDPDEAYRKAVDKTGLLAQLRASGMHPTNVAES